MRMVSPIPSASRVPRPTADFSEPDHLVPASVTPRCSGYGIRSRQQAVGGDRVGHRRGLHRDLEVGEVQALHQLDRLHRGGDQRLDGVVVLELAQVLGQRARVDPDAQRDAELGGALGHLGHLLGAADVAGIEPHAMRTGIERLERQRVVEVDVGDHRDRRLAHDRAQRLDVLLARHGHAHDVGAGLGHAADLGHRGGQVGRLGLGHRLHGDGRSAADRHVSDVDLALRGHGPECRAGSGPRPPLVRRGRRRRGRGRGSLGRVVVVGPTAGSHCGAGAPPGRRTSARPGSAAPGSRSPAWAGTSRPSRRCRPRSACRA